jgi:hypothetical protein
MLSFIRSCCARISTISRCAKSSMRSAAKLTNSIPKRVKNISYECLRTPGLILKLLLRLLLKAREYMACKSGEGYRPICRPFEDGCAKLNKTFSFKDTDSNSIPLESEAGLHPTQEEQQKPTTILHKLAFILTDNDVSNTFTSNTIIDFMQILLEHIPTQNLKSTQHRTLALIKDTYQFQNNTKSYHHHLTAIIGAIQCDYKMSSEDADTWDTLFDGYINDIDTDQSTSLTIKDGTNISKKELVEIKNRAKDILKWLKEECRNHKEEPVSEKFPTPPVQPPVIQPNNIQQHTPHIPPLDFKQVDRNKDITPHSPLTPHSPTCRTTRYSSTARNPMTPRHLIHTAIRLVSKASTAMTPRTAKLTCKVNQVNQELHKLLEEYSTKDSSLDLTNSDFTMMYKDAHQIKRIGAYSARRLSVLIDPIGVTNAANAVGDAWDTYFVNKGVNQFLSAHLPKMLNICDDLDQNSTATKELMAKLNTAKTDSTKCLFLNNKLEENHFNDIVKRVQALPESTQKNNLLNHLIVIYRSPRIQVIRLNKFLDNSYNNSAELNSPDLKSLKTKLNELYNLVHKDNVNAHDIQIGSYGTFTDLLDPMKPAIEQIKTIEQKIPPVRPPGQVIPPTTRLPVASLVSPRSVKNGPTPIQIAVQMGYPYPQACAH